MPSHIVIQQVTKSTFTPSLLRELKSHIDACDFISLSSIKTFSATSASSWRRRLLPFDTAETAYLKAKLAAESFQILNVSICPFRLDGSKVVAYPYNFHLFPREEQSYSFSCQASYLESLARKGFDFNLCIYEGDLANSLRLLILGMQLHGERPCMTIDVCSDNQVNLILEYYNEKREKQDKKRAKLIKTLKKDLSELYSMGFGIDTDQSDKIEEAAKQLLEQLNQIKVEEKEMRKKEKEEKKAKAACKIVCDEDSSSSSSESSESDCDEPRILQLSDLKATTTATLTVPNLVSPAPVPLPLSAPGPVPASLPLPAPALALMQTVPVADVLPAGKIEVCMGGKCKNFEYLGG